MKNIKIPEYLQINQAMWDARTEVHFKSDFYDNISFVKGRNSLNEIELDMLGDVRGLKVLHLQCHFGQDSISLARMGAQVTGVDFSGEALRRADQLAQECGVKVRFIESDVYELPKVLDENFDLVFTSYGVVGWLPDMKKWADTIQHFLKPGGVFVMAEFHPVVWMFDDDFTSITFPYMNSGALREEPEGTYTDGGDALSNQSICWNHGLSEVMGNLMEAGIVIQFFREFDYSPYNCFRKTIEYAPGKFRIEHMGDKLPMVYAIKGNKL